MHTPYEFSRNVCILIRKTHVFSLKGGQCGPCTWLYGRVLIRGPYVQERGAREQALALVGVLPPGVAAAAHVPVFSL